MPLNEGYVALYDSPKLDNFFGSSSLRIRVDFFSILELPFFSLVDSFFFFVGVHQYTNIS